MRSACRPWSLRPTDYVRRQIRFTPYPTEDVGWIIANTGPEIRLFSSDYPHVEGGRKPLELLRSRRWGDVDDSVRQAFYWRQLPRPDGHRRSPTRRRGLRLDLREDAATGEATRTRRLLIISFRSSPTGATSMRWGRSAARTPSACRRRRSARTRAHSVPSVSVRPSELLQCPDGTQSDFTPPSLLVSRFWAEAVQSASRRAMRVLGATAR